MVKKHYCKNCGEEIDFFEDEVNYKINYANETIPTGSVEAICKYCGTVNIVKIKIKPILVKERVQMEKEELYEVKELTEEEVVKINGKLDKERALKILDSYNDKNNKDAKYLVVISTRNEEEVNFYIAPNTEFYTSTYKALIERIYDDKLRIIGQDVKMIAINFFTSLQDLALLYSTDKEINTFTFVTRNKLFNKNPQTKRPIFLMDIVNNRDGIKDYIQKCINEYEKQEERNN